MLILKIQEVITMFIFNILHVIGVAFGFVGALFSSAIMLHVKTDKVRLSRGRIVRRISILTWAGLLFLIISGIPLTVDYLDGYNIILFIKHLCVTIIVVDALIIHFRLFPRYFRQIGTPLFDRTYNMMKRVGMLSMACWLSTIVLSAFLGND
jgi:hypothetical protein